MSWSGPGMAGLAMVSVGLWTLRVALAARGRRVAAAAVAALEALVFASVFSTLMSDLGSWDRVAGYAVGVAAGTVGGLLVNDRLNPAAAVVEVVTPGDGAAVRDALLARGWPATAVAATGVNGPATLVFLAVGGRLVDEVVAVVRQVAPDSNWTVRPATSVHRSVAFAPA